MNPLTPKSTLKKLLPYLTALLALTVVSASHAADAKSKSVKKDASPKAMPTSALLPVGPGTGSEGAVGDATVSNEVAGEDKKPLVGPEGKIYSSLLPPPPDRLAGKDVIVLLAGKKTKVTCGGQCRIAVLGNEEWVTKEDPSESEMIKDTCSFTLKPNPNVKYGYTNLMVRTTLYASHRRIEIREDRNPAALRRFKDVVDICQ